MKNVTAFLIGVVGGAIAGWYGTKRYYKTESDIRVKNMQAFCDQTIAEANRKINDAKAKVENAEVRAQRAADDRQIFAEALTRLGYAGGREDTPTPVYAEEKTAHPSEEDNYFSDPEVLGIPLTQELQQNEEQRKRPPELIDKETFNSDTFHGFEQKEVHWYPKDGVLLDGDNNELMDDPYSFLGTEWPAIVERDGEAYVRNFRWEIDYLVLECSGLGMDNMSIPT